MEYIATQKYLRISPKKVRSLVGLVKKMKPSKAVEVLPYVNKASSLPLMKVIKTALANAKMQGANENDLYFKEIQIGEGPTLKRGRVASRSRFHAIHKKMTHIRVIVETRDEKEVKKLKKQNLLSKKANKKTTVKKGNK